MKKKHEITPLPVLLFFLTLSQGLFSQQKEAFQVLVEHDQSLTEWKNFPEKYEERIQKISTLNTVLGEEKRLFVDNLLRSMKYTKEGKLDSALSVCYQQFYGDILLDNTDSIMLYRQIAAIYRSLGDHIVSKKNTLRALKIIEQNGYELQTIATELAQIYMDAGMLDSAAYFLRKPLGNTVDSFGVYMNLASFYGGVPEIRNMDSVYYYSKAALVLYDNFQYDNDLAYLYMGFGNVKKSEDDYDSAIYYFQKVLDEHAKNPIWYPYLDANIQLVEIFKELDMQDSATYYMDNFFLCPCLGHDTKSQLNTIKFEYYHEIGDEQQAQKFLLKSIESRDSLIQDLENNINDLSQLNVSQFKVIEENLRIKDENIRIIKSRNIAYFTSVIAMLFLITLVVIYFVRKLQRKKEILRITKILMKRKIQGLETNEEKLKLDLRYKNVDLNKLASNLALKSSFFTDHRDKLKEISKSDEGTIKTQLKKYIVELNTLELIDKNIDALQGDIDRVNNKLTAGLKEHFPGLTDNDIQVCTLHLLDLTTKEIAVIRGVTPKSIQVARYRIKKKMNLSKDEDIVSFIEKRILEPEV